MNDLPNHIVLIPDGNTRWAAANKLSPFEGYKKGAERALEVMSHAREVGIHTLTFWGLSTENWRHRPKEELDFLILLLTELITSSLEEALENGVRIMHIGRKDRLPKSLMDKVHEAEEITKDKQNHVLNLALDYGGHDEIIRATKAIVADVVSGKLDPEDMGEALSSEHKVAPTVYSGYLDTGGQKYPFPDFIIRTSGEVRTSGFMPWQSVYSELYFEPCFWPDFTAEKLDLALAEFKNRQRRFGGGHG